MNCSSDSHYKFIILTSVVTYRSFAYDNYHGVIFGSMKVYVFGKASVKLPLQLVVCFTCLCLEFSRQCFNL